MQGIMDAHCLMALRNVGMWRFRKRSTYPYWILRLIALKNATFLTKNTPPQVITLQYRLVMEGGILMISTEM